MSPWFLLIVLLVVAFASIALWSRRRSRLWARLVWVSLAAVPVVPLVSYLVVTDRERIVSLCRDMAEAVEAGDMPAIRRKLASDFEARDLNGAEFIERLEQTLTLHHVIDPALRNFEVTFPVDNQGAVTFNATCRVQSAEGYFDRLPSRWRLTLRKTGHTWEVTTIETIPVPPLNARDLRELLR